MPTLTSPSVTTSPPTKSDALAAVAVLELADAERDEVQRSTGCVSYDR